MRKYLIQRFIHSLTILFGISVLVFVLVELAPGDVVDSMISPEDFVTPEVKEQMRQELGLDEPAPVRYVRWLGRVVQGDFGYSLAARKPINEMILARMPTTAIDGVPRIAAPDNASSDSAYARRPLGRTEITHASHASSACSRRDART